jgi:four helix bundle protein
METQHKQYDLEERTQSFARQVFGFVAALSHSVVNIEIVKQVVRSAGSVGANYIEANESLSKKDFAMRIKICRKEARETRYWLQLIEADGEDMVNKRLALIKEATELTKIFSSIIEKAT